LTKVRDNDRNTGGGFASRWSQRKRAAEAGLTDDLAPAPGTDGKTQVAETAPDQRSDDEVLAELGLPDPDTLNEGDDFGAFMSKAVPQRLRSRALRRLWLSNPAYAEIDMLVEYGGDFTDAATVVENLQTAYTVGRGFADKFLKPDDDMAEEPVDSPDPAAAEEIADSAAAQPVPGEPAGDSASDAEAPEPEPEVMADSGAQPIPRRRMRFRMVED
jgi:hypothetical protein